MADLSWFNVADYNLSRVLPTGVYEVVIIDSRMQAAAAGNGEYLLIGFEVIAGEHVGRRVYTRLYLNHPNPKAVEIGRSRLASIVRAVGLTKVNDSAEMHNIPLEISVKVVSSKDGGETYNEVVAFRAVNRSGGQRGVDNRHDKSPWGF